jgi:hypothetical protein
MANYQMLKDFLFIYHLSFGFHLNFEFSLRSRYGEVGLWHLTLDILPAGSGQSIPTIFPEEP